MKLESFFVDTLKSLQKHSTCSRIKVSSLIVKNSRIISMGINGVPSGFRHCEDVFCTADKESAEYDALHHKFAIENEIHAEQNSIAYAARNGISTEGCDMYVSITPCNQCAKLIIAAGIKRVYYLEEYDRSDCSGVNLLKQAKIDLQKI